LAENKNESNGEKKSEDQIRPALFSTFVRFQDFFKLAAIFSPTAKNSD